jgi:type II secretory pathway component PulL
VDKKYDMLKSIYEQQSHKSLHDSQKLQIRAPKLVEVSTIDYSPSKNNVSMSVVLPSFSNMRERQDETMYWEPLSTTLLNTTSYR